MGGYANLAFPIKSCLGYTPGIKYVYLLEEGRCFARQKLVLWSVLRCFGHNTLGIPIFKCSLNFILNVFLSFLFLLVLNSFLYYANYIQNGKHEFKYSAAAKPDISVLTT